MVPGARDKMVEAVRGALRRLDVDLVRHRPMRDPVQLTLLKSAELGVATILDVGANQGQFAQDVFGRGWQGKLVSFEPIAQNHAALERNAREFPERWRVPAAMALGSEGAETSIGVSENSVSSSILPIARMTTELLQETRFVRHEKIAVKRLDDVIEPDWESPFAMKIDTQGFELEVLRGATEVLTRSRVLMIEMSLAPLYEGAPCFDEVYRYCGTAGFRCIALTEGFADYDRNEVLQVDGVFVRTD